MFVICMLVQYLLVHLKLVKQLISQFAYDAMTFLQGPFSCFLHLKQLLKIYLQIVQEGHHIIKREFFEKYALKNRFDLQFPKHFIKRVTTIEKVKMKLRRTVGKLNNKFCE